MAGDSELLRLRNGQRSRRGDPRKVEQIIAGKNLRFSEDGITQSDIDVEFCVDLPEEHGFAGKPPATARSIGQFLLGEASRKLR